MICQSYSNDKRSKNLDAWMRSEPMTFADYRYIKIRILIHALDLHILQLQVNGVKCLKFLFDFEQQNNPPPVLQGVKPGREFFFFILRVHEGPYSVLHHLHFSILHSPYLLGLPAEAEKSVRWFSFCSRIKGATISVLDHSVEMEQIHDVINIGL